MVLKNSFIVFIALLIGGLLNFASISLFSRLLSPTEYGLFALALAASTLSIAFVFQWVYFSVLRFLPQKDHAQNKVYLSNFIFILSVLSFAFIVFVALVYGVDRNLTHIFDDLPLIVWVLVPCAAICESLYNIVCHYARLVSEKIKLYAVATVIRSVLYIGLGYFLIEAGYSYIGLLVAVVLSFLVPALGLIGRERAYRTLSKADLQKSIAKDVLRFGLPIVAFMSLQTAIASTDNVLLTVFIGPEATGQFAVALDLVTKSLIFLMIIINRTTYPLTVKCMEMEGVDAAAQQYKHNVTFLMMLSIPACAGLSVLSGNIAGNLLGEDFRETASEIIPFITLISFFNCAFQFYISPAFQLMKKTQTMVFPVLIAFVSNIILSSALIPLYGIHGAIGGSLGAYLICCIVGFYCVRKIFPLPVPALDLLKVLIATGLMVAAIWPFKDTVSLFYLIFAICLGGGVYTLCCGLLNVGGYTKQGLAYLKKMKASV